MSWKNIRKNTFDTKLGKNFPDKTPKNMIHKSLSW